MLSRGAARSTSSHTKCRRRSPTSSPRDRSNRVGAKLPESPTTRKPSTAAAVLNVASLTFFRPSTVVCYMTAEESQAEPPSDERFPESLWLATTPETDYEPLADGLEGSLVRRWLRPRLLSCHVTHDGRRAQKS